MKLVILYYRDKKIEANRDAGFLGVNYGNK
jgi:hypothetical protein